MRTNLKTRNLARIGIMGAIGFVLMMIDLPIAFIAPSFMKLDLSDVPALISGFAMGPVAGIGVQLVKNLLNVAKTSTGGVGEISNFIVGSTYVIVATYLYRKNRTMKNAAIGLVMGVLAMSLIAMASNYYVVFPLYSKIMIPMEKLVDFGRAINPRIDSLATMMLYSVLPFNLIKGSVNGIVTVLIYKRVRRFL